MRKADVALCTAPHSDVRINGTATRGMASDHKRSLSRAEKAENRTEKSGGGVMIASHDTNGLDQAGNHEPGSPSGTRPGQSCLLHPVFSGAIPLGPPSQCRLANFLHYFGHYVKISLVS